MCSDDQAFLPIVRQSFDEGRTWTCLQSLSHAVAARPQAAAIAFRDGGCSLTCVIGGVDVEESTGASRSRSLQGGAVTGRVDCSADNGTTWQRHASLPTSTRRAVAVEINGTIWVLGGVRGDTGAFAGDNVQFWAEWSSPGTASCAIARWWPAPISLPASNLVDMQALALQRPAPDVGPGRRGGLLATLVLMEVIYSTNSSRAYNTWLSSNFIDWISVGSAPLSFERVDVSPSLFSRARQALMRGPTDANGTETAIWLGHSQGSASALFRMIFDPPVDPVTGMVGNYFEVVDTFYPSPALVPLHSPLAVGAQPPYNESAPTGPLIVAPVLTAAAILERPSGERVIVGFSRSVDAPLQPGDGGLVRPSPATPVLEVTPRVHAWHGTFRQCSGGAYFAPGATAPPGYYLRGCVDGPDDDIFAKCSFCRPFYAYASTRCQMGPGPIPAASDAQCITCGQTCPPGSSAVSPCNATRGVVCSDLSDPVDPVDNGGGTTTQRPFAVAPDAFGSEAAVSGLVLAALLSALVAALLLGPALLAPASAAAACAVLAEGQLHSTAARADLGGPMSTTEAAEEFGGEMAATGASSGGSGRSTSGSSSVVLHGPLSSRDMRAARAASAAAVSASPPRTLRSTGQGRVRGVAVGAAVTLPALVALLARAWQGGLAYAAVAAASRDPILVTAGDTLATGLLLVLLGSAACLVALRGRVARLRLHTLAGCPSARGAFAYGAGLFLATLAHPAVLVHVVLPGNSVASGVNRPFALALVWAVLYDALALFANLTVIVGMSGKLVGPVGLAVVFGSAISSMASAGLSAQTLLRLSGRSACGWGPSPALHAGLGAGSAAAGASAAPAPKVEVLEEHGARGEGAQPGSAAAPAPASEASSPHGAVVRLNPLQPSAAWRIIASAGADFAPPREAPQERPLPFAIRVSNPNGAPAAAAAAAAAAGVDAGSESSSSSSSNAAAAAAMAQLIQLTAIAHAAVVAAAADEEDDDENGSSRLDEDADEGERGESGEEEANGSAQGGPASLGTNPGFLPF